MNRYIGLPLTSSRNNHNKTKNRICFVHNTSRDFNTLRYKGVVVITTKIAQLDATDACTCGLNSPGFRMDLVTSHMLNGYPMTTEIMWSWATLRLHILAAKCALLS